MMWNVAIIMLYEQVISELILGVFSIPDIIIGYISELIPILGVIIGYKLSDKQWNKQREIQKQSIAIGFYYEIKEIEKIIPAKMQPI